MRGARETEGGGAIARGRTKEERKEAYKKPGRATSSTVSRTLRTIQVENKRVQEREDRVSKARQLEPVERTRKDQLEKYRREKLRAQEKLNKKTVVPFRTGVYKPDKTIKPLIEVVTRSDRRSGRSATPRASRQLISKYKNSSPKSFAPNKFQFSMNVLVPQSQLLQEDRSQKAEEISKASEEKNDSKKNEEISEASEKKNNSKKNEEISEALEEKDDTKIIEEVPVTEEEKDDSKKTEEVLVTEEEKEEVDYSKTEVTPAWLSPFISQAARRYQTAPGSPLRPPTGLLVDIEDSPALQPGGLPGSGHPSDN